MKSNVYVVIKYYQKKNTSRVCTDCKSDKSKVMTTTNIKKIFGITNEDIEDSDLYYFNVSSYGNIGRKFIVKDVEEYVDNLIKKGNIKLKKKKEKYTNTIKYYQRKKEIDEFISNKIKNCDEPSILNIRNEYIKSNILDFSDVKEQLLQEEEKIYKINEQKKLFFNNLTDIINEKIKNKQFIEELKLNDEDTQYFIHSKWFKSYIANLKNYIVNNYSNLFDHIIITKACILKAGISDIVIKNIINKLSIKKWKVIRTSRLEEKLHFAGLKLRSDSKICKCYIAGDIENVNKYIDVKISTIDDIVEIMKEMDFYYKYTEYPEINNKELKKYSKYINDEESDDDNNYKYKYYNSYYYTYTKPIHEINLGAKIKALNLVSKKLMENAPKNVVELYNKIKNKKK